ncbi:MAG: hypothetical protein LBT74_12430 [Acidobacteriota bacterium]|nr:hypothetical protein [Acidobacteriota bacterium]
MKASDAAPTTAKKPKHMMGLNDTLVFCGRELHVQTENANFPEPCIVTQVFAGGRVLLSRKSPFRDAGGAQLWTQGAQARFLRESMAAQHRDVLRELGKLAEERRAINQPTVRAVEDGDAEHAGKHPDRG